MAIFTQNTYEFVPLSSANFLQWARGKMGNFYFPLSEFEIQTQTLLRNNPSLNEQEAASTIYFSMLAETPRPSSDELVFVPYFTDNMSPSQLLSTETKIFDASENGIPHNLKVSPERSGMGGEEFRRIANGLKENLRWKYPVFSSKDDTSNNELVPIYEAEFVTKSQAWDLNKYKLELYLSKLGLMEGVKKTLAEQSRAAQAGQAAAQASQAAAAYAAAQAKIAKEKAEAARIEAARAEAEAKAEAEASAKQEAEFRQQIENISNGLPADYKPKRGVWFVVALAAVGIYFVTRGGRNGR